MFPFLNPQKTGGEGGVGGGQGNFFGSGGGGDFSPVPP